MVHGYNLSGEVLSVFPGSKRYVMLRAVSGVKLVDSLGNIQLQKHLSKSSMILTPMCDGKYTLLRCIIWCPNASLCNITRL